MAAFDLTSPLFIQIKADRDQDAYSGSVHQDGSELSFSLSSMGLGPRVKALKERSWTLGDLVEAIFRFDPHELQRFDERVQLEVGRYLYAQTLGQLPESLQQDLSGATSLDLRILTDEEWIARLPWHLLTERNIFRATTGWSIALQGQAAFFKTDCRLPPSPRLLIVAPQPKGLPPTDADEHLEELENLLASRDQRLSFGNNLRLARTWEEFLNAVEEFRPELIYYYGHGVGGPRQTRLAFASGPDQHRVDKPIADFALCVRRLERPPLLAYINCCQGDAGGFLGAGMQLSHTIPAVITNRTVAEISVAQAQAMTLWRLLLIHAMTPHQAVSTIYVGLDLRQLTLADIRWITPVLHAHYRTWRAQAPTPPDRLTADPHWHLKINRVSQYNSVIAQTRLMLREQKPKSLVFVWYGQEGQGIEIFHRRLLVELREELSNAYVHPIRPRWPEHLANYDTAFSDVLTEAFRVNSLEDIPARLRYESRGALTLLYVRHEPVRSTRLINPASLKEYVRWWDTAFAPLLEKKQFALLTVSFLVSNPPLFAENIEEEQIEEAELKQTVFWLLDEMENVAKKDLLRFLRTHNLDLPRDRRDAALQKILNKTGGRYEQTIEDLKALRRSVWQVEEENSTSGKNSGKKRYNY